MMKTMFWMITAAIFGLVAAGHIVRVINGWAVRVGEWGVPMWMSWIALLLASAMCVWSISLATDDAPDRQARVG